MCSKVERSNIPFSAKARNFFLDLKARKVNSIVGSLADECLGACCQLRWGRCIFASLLPYGLGWLSRKACCQRKPSCTPLALFLKTVPTNPAQNSSFVRTNFLSVMVLEKLENMIIYVHLNLWKNFKPCYGWNHLICHKLPVPGVLAWGVQWGGGWVSITCQEKQGGLRKAE